MTRLILKISLLLGFIACFGVEGSVNTYSYPDTICKSNHGENSRSTKYSVKVIQHGVASSAYVMFDKNQEEEGNLTANPHNHWTNFSYKGDVAVEIERLDGQPITDVGIYPLKKGYVASINGKKAILNIAASSVPLQLFVRMNGLEKDSLFLFADPIETDIPNIKDKNVALIRTGDGIDTVYKKLNGKEKTVVFSEGVHRWGSEVGPDYKGYKLPLNSNKNIYIPGGAYVVGSFSGKDKSDVKVYGRGIISGCGLDRIANTKGIPFTLINMDGAGKNQTVEGLVLIDAPHFNILLRGEKSLVDNVKMMSWWHQTDGITLGNKSVGKNSFYKVDDDNIKLYGDNGYYENNTFFHQINGAPFQFSWGGSSQHGDGNRIVNSYIVESIYKNMKDTSNTAVINSRSGNDSLTENNSWDGLYIDNGCHRLVGLDGGDKPGLYKNFTIKNVEINTLGNKPPQASWSYLVRGKFENIRIENFLVNGKKITATNENTEATDKGQLWFHGDTQALKIQ